MAKKSFFETVETKPNFSELEKKLLREWYKKGIVKKYLQKNANSQKYYSFLDGPITANNPMGVHHAWGRTYKDLWQRFKNMQGYKQRFQNGFDCQGLWVEVEVEKELGLKSKRDIENLVPGDVKASIAKFVELCKERVKKYSSIQTDQSKRLGYFMDWDNSYYTMSDENNYMIWHFLKKCHERELIYKGHDSVAWCPRCGTAISQHEMLTEDYQTLTHKSVVLKFPTKKGEYLLAWTTTPWSIPGTIALMVNPEFDYVKVKQGDSIYILAKGRLAGLKGSYEILEEFKGKRLLGKTFTHPYFNFPALKSQRFPVIPSEEFVTLDVGTGIVTNNPGVGHEDYLAARAVNLAPVESVDAGANFIQGYSWLSGKNAKENETIDAILKDLDEKGFVYAIYDYEHRYPVCWRCKTELIFRVVDEWYIAMDPLREPMKKVTKKINWLPKFGLKRELDWLKNMDDWLISKKRYWGLALPIWVCKNGHFEVIGGKEELKEKATSGWEKFNGHTPHRPWIDEVRIKCDKCNEEMSRIPDVGNPWLDAGIVSFSTISKDNKSEPLYKANRKEFEKWYPADFITESFPGQFKNWFYSLLAMSTVLEDKEPFKTVLGFATLLGADGRPMHKSWGNAIEFNEGAEAIGVDVMRWMFVRQNPTDNLLFGYHIADETRRRFHLKLWNVYNFFVTYANLDGWRPTTNNQQSTTSNSILDRWILARLNQTIKGVTDSLEKYDAYGASGEIEAFVDDLSLWYIRRSRERVGPAKESEEDATSFYQTAYFVLVSIAKLLAPFTPYISELIYENLTEDESVHLADWPEGNILSDEDMEILNEMQAIREIIEKAHATRKEAKIPVRQPLSELRIKNYELGTRELDKLILDEVNVKSTSFKKGSGEINVELDTVITPELEEEAQARKLVRQIQEERKNMGMNLTQKIRISNEWIPKDKKLVQWILKKTVATKIEHGNFKVAKEV